MMSKVTVGIIRAEMTGGEEDHGSSSSSRSSPVSARSVGTSRTRRGRRGGCARPPGRYKTELCRQFQEHGGVCWYGQCCQFAHGPAELRSVACHPKYKTDLCRPFHSTGLCPYGARCHFIHNDDPPALLGLEPVPPPPLGSYLGAELDVEQQLVGLVLLVLDPAVVFPPSRRIPQQPREREFDLRSPAASCIKELMANRQSDASKSCCDVAGWSRSVGYRPSDSFYRTWSNNLQNELIFQ